MLETLDYIYSYWQYNDHFIFRFLYVSLIWAYQLSMVGSPIPFEALIYIDEVLIISIDWLRFTKLV